MFSNFYPLFSLTNLSISHFYYTNLSALADAKTARWQIVVTKTVASKSIQPCKCHITNLKWHFCLWWNHTNAHNSWKKLYSDKEPSNGNSKGSFHIKFNGRCNPMFQNFLVFMNFIALKIFCFVRFLSYTCWNFTTRWRFTIQAFFLLMGQCKFAYIFVNTLHRRTEIGFWVS